MTTKYLVDIVHDALGRGKQFELVNRKSLEAFQQ